MGTVGFAGLLPALCTSLVGSGLGERDVVGEAVGEVGTNIIGERAPAIPADTTDCHID
jgi:hypothetical protein